MYVNCGIRCAGGFGRQLEAVRKRGGGGAVDMFALIG